MAQNVHVVLKKSVRYIGLQLYYFIITPTQVFFRKYCKIFWDSFCYRTPQMAAHVSGMVAVMKIAVLKSSCSEKNVIKKIAIPIDNLN